MLTNMKVVVYSLRTEVGLVRDLSEIQLERRSGAFEF